MSVSQMRRTSGKTHIDYSPLSVLHLLILHNAKLRTTSYIGTPSDRGYNSMTQEDAKNFSEIISEQNKESESSLKKDIKNALRFSFRRKKRPKECEIQEEAAGSR